MITVDTIAERDAVPRAVRYVGREDGRIDVYQEGDSLPPLPSQGAPGVPGEVTMRQARLALLAAGKLDAVEAAINALPDPPKSAARITWEHSQTVQRYNGFVSQLAPALGMSEAQIDGLFIAAAGL